MVRTTPEIADRFARIALTHIGREYPNKLDHVLNGPDDLRSPRDLHPIFFGSFDWHSCVHGYWLLARVYSRYPGLAASSDIRELFDRQITLQNVAGELAYLDAPMRAGFERPYGWAWLLMLSAEFERLADADGRRWATTFRPLAAAFVERFIGFVPKATYPIRAGTHFNTAFALCLALEYAAAVDHAELRALLSRTAVHWYGRDENCQAWEPSGDDFLSPALVEAECMRRVLDASEFSSWMGRFLPGLASGRPEPLFVPATVSDRSDGKIAHLDGLNLSRAWCWRSLSGTWGHGDPRRAIATDAADVHLAAGLDRVAGDYMGEHWLASFALLALDAGAGA